MDGEPPPALIRAAQVRRPHGVHGEVRVEPLGGDARRFRRGLRLTVEGSDRVLRVRSARGLGDGDVLLGFIGIDTPEAAAPLRGAYLSVPRDRTRPLARGEWFVWQLVGLVAVDPEGRELGRVEDVENGVANDVLVLSTPDGERRLPMVSAFVTAVEPEAGRIVVTPWEEEPDEV